MKIIENLQSAARKAVLPVAAILLSAGAYGRDVRTVEGYCRYVVPRTVSIDEAEEIALQRAITDALAAEFGTIVHSEVWTELKNDKGASSSAAWAMGSNMVKGEWLETIGSPRIKHSTSAEGYVVELWVKGKAAAIDSQHIDVKATVKQASSRGIFESTKFKSGDRLIVELESPVDGYACIFLADAEGNVLQLLPFAGQSAGSTAVKGGTKQVFFADNSAEDEEQYSLYTSSESERNVLYIIFSPEKFTKPISSLAGNLRLVGGEEFRRWLSRLRASDPSAQTIIRALTISG